MTTMFNAGYAAAKSKKISMPAHCPVFNAAIKGFAVGNPKTVELVMQWREGFEARIDEECAAILAAQPTPFKVGDNVAVINGNGDRLSGRTVMNIETTGDETLYYVYPETPWYGVRADRLIAEA